MHKRTARSVLLVDFTSAAIAKAEPQRPVEHAN